MQDRLPSPTGSPRVHAGDAPAAPVLDGALVYVVSSDPAVRRSLALLMEAESFLVRPFACADTFLTGVCTAPVGVRRCLLVEHRSSDGEEGLTLVRRLAAAGLEMPAVVLTAASRPSARGHTAEAGDLVAFADSFHVEDVLRAVSDAVRPHG